MIISKSLVIFLLALSNVGIYNCKSPTDNKSEREFLDFAKKNAISFEVEFPDDRLDFWGEIVGDTDIIGLGEARHDAREHFLIKSRLIKYLIKEKNFTILAMEESLNSTRKINDYLLYGIGDPEILLNGMGNWSIWDTEELLNLVKWLRSYNENMDNPKKVIFFGCDITDPSPGVIRVKDYLNLLTDSQIQKSEKENFGENLISEMIWPNIVSNYKSASSEEIKKITNHYKIIEKFFEDNREAFIQASSKTEYDWHFLVLKNLKQSHQFFIKAALDNFETAGTIREKAMTENIKWRMDNSSSERMILWAHNFHILKSEFDLNIPNRPATKGLIPMGNYIDDYFGETYLSVGFSFYEDNYPHPLPLTKKGTIDDILNKVGKELFFIDIRGFGEVRDKPTWLQKKQKMRGEGGEITMIPSKTFDVYVFSKIITPTTKTRSAIRKFEKLNKR